MKPLIRDDANYRNEVVSQTQYSLRIKKLKSKDTRVYNQNTDSLRVQTGVKLLKFVLQKFDGDILKWKIFEELFGAAVHKNERISSIEKFTYLISYLEKAHLQAVENFPLINDLIFKLELDVSANVRALKAVGIQQEHFGSLLIPIILKIYRTLYCCR